MEEGREYQKAIEYLCGLVKNGELKIGSKLPTERKLAETLSIGRNSTREALRILENMGLIACRQGSGNYITGNMTKTISGVVEMMLLLRQVTKEEVFIFRRDMEKAVCRAVIAKGNIEKWYDEILEILSGDLNAQSLEEQIETDRRFHYMLIQATENQMWICISEAIVTIYQNWIESVLKVADLDMKQKLKEFHLALLLALKKGSWKLCEQAVDSHYDLVDEKLSQISDKFSL
ncbi:FadR family transcriptional regulator [Lachnospiraceae bacterium]|nr:FadR family transcriptional regulator [Lachnospiraceae bacterium]